MYITVATVDRIVQASDRRITWFRNGKPVRTNDDTNKAVLVDCHNGRFSVAYSGLAKIKGKSTESIIAEIFSGINLKSHSPKILFDAFIDQLSNIFRKTGIPAKNKDILKTSISIAGHLYTGDVFWLRVTNYTDKDGDDIGLQNDFKCYGRLIEKPNLKDKTKAVYVEIGGISDVHAKKILENEILRLRRNNFFHRTSGRAVSNKLVEIIREFAGRPEAQDLVGMNCMTTVLNAPPESNHLFSYHNVGESLVQYGPEFVFDGEVISNFEAGPIR